MPRRNRRKSKPQANLATTDESPEMKTPIIVSSSPLLANSQPQHPSSEPKPCNSSSIEGHEPSGPPETDHMKFAHVKAADNKLSTRECLTLLATVNAFEESPGKESNRIDWDKVANILNSQAFHGIRGKNYFEPAMCQEQYINLLKSYENKVRPMFDGENQCSMVLRELIYECEMDDSRQTIFENSLKENGNESQV